MSDKKRETSYQVIVAIIGASAVCLTAIIGLWQPLVTRLVDIFLPVATPSLSSTTPIPVLTNPAPSIGTDLTPTAPVWSPNPILQEKETFPLSPITYRSLSVGYGEVYVGVARRFAIRAYNYSTMELKENVPYTVFVIKGPNLLIKGPTEVVIEISDGEWRHWVNAYDDNFIGGLVIDRVESIRKLPDFSVVGYKEIEIPIPYPYNLTVTAPSP